MFNFNNVGKPFLLTSIKLLYLFIHNTTYSRILFLYFNPVSEMNDREDLLSTQFHTTINPCNFLVLIL